MLAIANRSAGQANRATEVVRKFLTTLSSSCVIAFTDGSALTNPGLCGASTVIYYSGTNTQFVIVETPISNCSTSYYREVRCILSALDSKAAVQEALQQNLSQTPGGQKLYTFHILLSQIDEITLTVRERYGTKKSTSSDWNRGTESM